LLREKPEDRDGHCEGDGRVRGRPAPKDPAAQQAEFENMGQVRADAVRRMGTTCNRFVSGSDYTSDYLSLANGPGNQPGRGISGGAAQDKQDEWQSNRQKSADWDSGP